MKAQWIGALADSAAALLGSGGDQLFAPGGLDDLLGRPYRDPDRLFDQHVDAALEQLAGQHMMQTVRAADIGTVEVLFAIEQLLDALIGVDLPAAEALDPLRKTTGPVECRVDSRDDAEALFAPL